MGAAGAKPAEGAMDVAEATSYPWPGGKETVNISFELEKSFPFSVVSLTKR